MTGSTSSPVSSDKPAPLCHDGNEHEWEYQEEVYGDGGVPNGGERIECWMECCYCHARKEPESGDE